MRNRKANRNRIAIIIIIAVIAILMILLPVMSILSNVINYGRKLDKLFFSGTIAVDGEEKENVRCKYSLRSNRPCVGVRI